ncbi:MAG: nicotinate-nucleotide--dimethylbenzimidazole phosphoribosyltransferase [Haloarculaceae archaeon]
MRLILAAGTTETALVDGISAAGAAPEVMRHTPSADAELLVYGDVVHAPMVPVSPSGCPTPAVVTYAARRRLGFDCTVVDAGLDEPTGAPTVDVGAAPGGDVRESEPVPDAGAVFAAARDFGAGLPDEEVMVAETVPGGTTTALGVLRALGEEVSVSSSLPENPRELKQRVVREGLGASGLSPGDAAGDPTRALRLMGDPVLAATAGLAAGAAESGTAVTLAGGTQLLTAAALARHAGVDAPLSLATTSFVAGEEGVELGAAADAFDLDLTVTDPGFTGDHVAMERYLAGEGKEGVGMGGALALADAAEELPAVRETFVSVYERLGLAPAEAP